MTEGDDAAPSMKPSLSPSAVVGVGAVVVPPFSQQCRRSRGSESEAAAEVVPRLDAISRGGDEEEDEDGGGGGDKPFHVHRRIQRAGSMFSAAAPSERVMMTEFLFCPELQIVQG